MKVEAPFIHLIKLHTKYYLYDVNSKMIVNISNDLFDFFKSNENIKAEIEIPHKLEDEVRRLLKYDLFSKTDTGYEIESPLRLRIAILNPLSVLQGNTMSISQ